MEQVEEGIKGRKKNYEEITKRIFVRSNPPRIPKIPRELLDRSILDRFRSINRSTLPRRRATNLKFLPRHRCRRRRILCLICSSPMTPRFFCLSLPRPYAASTLLLTRANNCWTCSFRKPHPEQFMNIIFVRQRSIMPEFISTISDLYLIKQYFRLIFDQCKRSIMVSI